MTKYFPFADEINIPCSWSDMLTLQWQNNALTATFLIPGNERQVVRVHFSEAQIIRILDEMPLSTELDPSPVVGLVPDHFAYRVEGARFWLMQSEAFRLIHKSAQHYRFVTGSTCLDVIASASPSIEVVGKL
jgi:hypothetical protein